MYLGYVSYIKINMYDNNSTKNNRKEIELYHYKGIIWEVVQYNLKVDNHNFKMDIGNTKVVTKK